MRKIILLLLVGGCASDVGALNKSLARLVGEPAVAALQSLGEPDTTSAAEESTTYRWRSRDFLGVQTGTGQLSLKQDCDVEIVADDAGRIVSADARGDPGACDDYLRRLQERNGDA